MMNRGALIEMEILTQFVFESHRHIEYVEVTNPKPQCPMSNA
jgi:hypothetical protein